MKNGNKHSTQSFKIVLTKAEIILNKIPNKFALFKEIVPSISETEAKKIEKKKIKSKKIEDEKNEDEKIEEKKKHLEFK